MSSRRKAAEGPPTFGAFGKRAEAIFSGFPADKAESEILWRISNQQINDKSDNNIRRNEAPAVQAPRIPGNSPAGQIGCKIVASRDGSTQASLMYSYRFHPKLVAKSTLSSRGSACKVAVEYNNDANDAGKLRDLEFGPHTALRAEPNLQNRFGSSGIERCSNQSFRDRLNIGSSLAWGGAVRFDTGNAKRGALAGFSFRGTTLHSVFPGFQMTVALDTSVETSSTKQSEHECHSNHIVPRGSIEFMYKNSLVLWSGLATLKDRLVQPELTSLLVIGTKTFAVAAKAVFDAGKVGKEWRTLQARIMQAGTNSEFSAWSSVDAAKNEGEADKHSAGVMFARKVSQEWQLASRFSLDVSSPSATPLVKFAAVRSIGSRAVYKFRVDTLGTVSFSAKKKVGEAVSLHGGTSLNFVRRQASPKFGIHIHISG